MGGSFADEITAGGGNHVILGDNGIALYQAGLLVAVRSGWTEHDGIDDIFAENGRHVVFGGGASDGIEIGTGNSVVFGDSGYVEIDGTLPTLAYSIDTAKGGIDTITTGNGDQIVAGGAFGDTITTGNGNSVVFGDSAHAEFSTARSRRPWPIPSIRVSAAPIRSRPATATDRGRRCFRGQDHHRQWLRHHLRRQCALRVCDLRRRPGAARRIAAGFPPSTQWTAAMM